jgi:hypothetical protein
MLGERGVLCPCYPKSLISRYNVLMDSILPTRPEIPQTPEEAWRRFTLLDLLILFSGQETALGILKWYGWLNFSDSSQRNSIGITIQFCLFIFLGAIFSIPCVYGIHFLFCHRRVRISGGEIVAVFTTIYWMIAFIIILIFPNGFLGAELLILASAIAFLVVPGSLFKLISEKDTPVACHWLNIYGIIIWPLSVLFLTFILLLSQMG